MTALVVFAHGSRVESANHAVRDVAARLAVTGGHLVEPAFLECGQPDLAAAIDLVAARGASRVIVIPYFLTLGTHLQRDLPLLIRSAAQRHPTLEIEVTPPLDGHPGLLQALVDRATAAAEIPNRNRPGALS